MNDESSVETMTDDQIARLLRAVGELQGRQIALEQRARDDHQTLEHRIGSAMEAARLASAECAALDVRIRGENGDNGLTGRLSALERSHRVMRSVVVWVAGVLAVVAASVVRGWLGL